MKEIQNSRFHKAVREFKAYIISEELMKTNGNICKAADGLGVHRNTLNRLIAEMNINVPEIKKIARNGH